MERNELLGICRKLLTPETVSSSLNNGYEVILIGKCLSYGHPNGRLDKLTIQYFPGIKVGKIVVYLFYRKIGEVILTKEETLEFESLYNKLDEYLNIYKDSLFKDFIKELFNE